MVDENRQWDEHGLRGAILRGDQEAWRALFDRYFDALFAYVDYRTGHRSDRTEEVVQDSWMVAVRRINSFDPARASFEKWMRGIAANVLRNHQRTWKRLERLDDTGTLSTDGNPGSKIELKEHIGLALTVLPSRYREVLFAKYDEKLSVIEIAKRWSTSPKAVESLLTRARNAFREAYAGLEKKR